MTALLESSIVANLSIVVCHRKIDCQYDGADCSKWKQSIVCIIKSLLESYIYIYLMASNATFTV